MTWAAILAIDGHIDEHGAMRRLELAVKDELAFWKRPEERGGGTSNQVSDPGLLGTLRLPRAPPRVSDPPERQAGHARSVEA
jgi:hypothetical protein